MIMKKILFLTVALVVIFLASNPVAVFAIGQTTDPIVIENALRGNEYQRTMIIINTEKSDSQMSVEASGQIGEWAEFYKQDDFQSPFFEVAMKSGEVLNVSVLFKVPADTPNGEYKGFISAIKKSDSLGETDGSSTSVSQKIDREVTIKVNDDEIVSFEVSIIPKTYDLAENEMLSIRLIYDNRGNTSISPQAQIKIKKDGQTVHNAIYIYPENQPLVRPGGIYEIPVIEIPTSNFEKGKYVAEMSFLTGEKIILEKKFGFSVGTINESNESRFLGFVYRIGGGNLTLGWILISGFFVAIAILIGFTERKRLFRKFNFQGKKIL